ncbi:dipeptide epimerase [Adhaeribacter radiodurans]|uniref:Dipeptide epimerase n=1 Tax=Adhaeribacter radiodurans TaxID=2745197 RepID=A0A7L7LD46_9BACT|nr:dipeptide epimerase [Adhaeribacter radiodurans]QMU30445.1 dipeptide epimerase [Adhaeribacter radiodurans]
MLTWHIETKVLSLRYTWKISRNAADSKINLFVRVSDQQFLGIGEAAPNVRYHETPELLLQQFQNLLRNGLAYIRSISELETLLKLYPVANSLRFAVESAYVHFICWQQQLTVSQFLKLPQPETVPTIFSLPIMAPELIGDFIKVNNLTRFSPLKVKVNQTDALVLVQAVAAVTVSPIIIDGNEAWTNPDELLVFLRELNGLPILFIEQPLPASQLEAYQYLKKQSPYPIFADESVTNEPDFEKLRAQFHGINMKLMKAGGYLNGLRILQETRAYGLQPMIGCMVETSLGIWSAMQLCSGIHYADLDGFLILKEEPFGMVKEEDGQLILNK